MKKIHNEELHNPYSVIKSRKMRWATHGEDEKYVDVSAVRNRVPVIGFSWSGLGPVVGYYIQSNKYSDVVTRTAVNLLTN
jgi:hypothetical protein